MVQRLKIRSAARANGVVIKFPESFEKLLAEGPKVGLDAPATRAFLDSGDEIFDVDLVDSDDIVYLSAGGDFNDPAGSQPQQPMPAVPQVQPMPAVPQVPNKSLPTTPAQVHQAKPVVQPVVKAVPVAVPVAQVEEVQSFTPVQSFIPMGGTLGSPGPTAPCPTLTATLTVLSPKAHFWRSKFVRLEGHKVFVGKHEGDKKPDVFKLHKGMAITGDPPAKPEKKLPVLYACVTSGDWKNPLWLNFPDENMRAEWCSAVKTAIEEGPGPIPPGLDAEFKPSSIRLWYQLGNAYKHNGGEGDVELHFLYRGASGINFSSINNTKIFVDGEQALEHPLWTDAYHYVKRFPAGEHTITGFLADEKLHKRKAKQLYFPGAYLIWFEFNTSFEILRVNMFDYDGMPPNPL